MFHGRPLNQIRFTTKLCGNVIAAVVKARAQRFKRVEQLGFVPSSSVYPTIGLMTHDDLPDVQREVQRLLGRCLVRLQQYERLMKSILAHHELSGPLHQLEAQRVERLESFATDSLGTLVTAMFESYVQVEGTERRVLDADKAPTDKVSFGFRVSMQMPQERFEQTKASLKALVNLRNELVHHLIDKFDLWSSEGCLAASQHLSECYSHIDEHFQQLRGWAESMDNARAMQASFVQSQAFTEFIINGILPDGSVDWTSSGIVRLLREAAQVLSQNGWTRLDKAVARIEQQDSAQLPAKYGCRTWPQLLHESRQFRLEYRANDNERKVGWYRER
jgi:hypothetical protein